MKKTSPARLLSARALSIGPSRIRSFKAKAAAAAPVGLSLIDLCSGFPDLPPALGVDESVSLRMRGLDHPHGSPTLRDLIASDLASRGVECQASSGITVTAGATEALNAVLLAAIEPGDEVLLFEPFFDSHVCQIRLAGGVPRFVRLERPHWRFDEDELAGAARRARAIIVNSPHNPTGRVFTRTELEGIARLADRHGLLIVSDETYAALSFDGRECASIASLPGMRERTAIVGGFTKTMTVPGWRLGYLAAPAWLSRPARNLLACTAQPPSAERQAKVAASLAAGDASRQALSAYHEARRAQMCRLLDAAGFRFSVPEGASFVFADAARLGLGNDLAVWRYLVESSAVAAVPGRCFYRRHVRTTSLRFCFARLPETLSAAADRLCPAAPAVPLA